MDLTHISDSDLLLKLKSLAVEERKLTLEVIHFLKEVEDRNLFAMRAYSSLHEFCVRELGYSSGAAYRRIESMRLLRDVPVAEKKVLTGELNLSVLSKVQTYVRHEKKYNKKTVTLEEKNELLNSFLGKSVREVDRELIRRSPTMAHQCRESAKPILGNKTALTLIADEELMDLINQAMSIGGSPGEDLGVLLKRALRGYVRKRSTYGIPGGVKAAAAGASDSKSSYIQNSTRTPTSGLKNAVVSSKLTRYIPKQTRIEIRRNAHHQCEWKDNHTNKRCKETKHLQIDHIHPYAMGGSNELQNLRLVCATHNRLKAERDFVIS